MRQIEYEKEVIEKLVVSKKYQKKFKIFLQRLLEGDEVIIFSGCVVNDTELDNFFTFLDINNLGKYIEHRSKYVGDSIYKNIIKADKNFDKILEKRGIEL